VELWLQNKGLHQTKSAPRFTAEGAAFAGEPQCSTDSERATPVNVGPLDSLDGGRTSHGLMLSYGNGQRAIRAPHLAPRAVRGQAAAALCNSTAEGSPSASLRNGPSEASPHASFAAVWFVTAHLHRLAGRSVEEGCPSRTSRPGSTSTGPLDRGHGRTLDEGCPSTDEPRPTRAASLGRLSNERMQQTRSALTTIAAALAADPRCSPDLLKA